MSDKKLEAIEAAYLAVRNCAIQGFISMDALMAIQKEYLKAKKP